MEDGADILDIGGQSTRPNAAYVVAEEELKRVIPVITRLREAEATKDVIISIDTFSAQVAEEAIKSGRL